MPLVGTILGGWGTPILAQETSAPVAVAVDTQPAPPPAPQPPGTPGTTRSTSVPGARARRPPPPPDAAASAGGAPPDLGARRRAPRAGDGHFLFEPGAGSELQ